MSFPAKFRRDLAAVYELRRDGRDDEAQALADLLAAELRAFRALVEQAAVALTRARRSPSFDAIPEAR